MTAGDETRDSRVLVGIVLVGGTLVLLSGPTWAGWVAALGVSSAWLVTGVAWVMSANRADHVRLARKIGSASVTKVWWLAWLWCVLDVLTGRWWAATALWLTFKGLVLFSRRELRRTRAAGDTGAARRQPAPRTVPKLRKVTVRH